jgi:hypothetical protein
VKFGPVILFVVALSGCLEARPFVEEGPPPDNALARQFLALESFDHWRLVANLKLPFKTYHTQGLKKVGGRFFLTAVGEKEGHLLVFDAATLALLHDERFAEDPDLIHPGGMDFDGKRLWIPLASNHAGGRSCLLAIHPETLRSEVFAQFADHLGCLLWDGRELRGAGWGTSWYSIPSGTAFAPADPSEYQDCKGLGDGYALAGGKLGRILPDGVLDLVRFEPSGEFRILRRIVLPRLDRDGSPGGNRPLTFNPMDFEPLENGTGLRFYFAPHDGFHPESGEATHLFAFDAPFRPHDKTPEPSSVRLR